MVIFIQSLANYMYLVLIETSGNQNYIFSTNKLKENFGASELTYQAGTEWVLDAIEQTTNLQIKADSNSLRQTLLDSNRNPPIENTDTPVEIIIATSGKAILITKEKETAKNIIKQVTLTALKKAPGLDICGVFEPFNWDDNNIDNIGEINRKLHQKFEVVRSKRPGPETRFQRLPVVDDCATSGLPAVIKEKDIEGNFVLRSAVSIAKREYTETAFYRIQELLKTNQLDIDFARSIRVLDEEFKDISPNATQNQAPPQVDWLAVVHADGNGLGEIILKFDEHLKKLNLTTNRDYINKLRALSIGLDICTERAFIKALNTFRDFTDNSVENNTTKNNTTKNNTKETEKTLVPVVPLVLGGDDLTVVCAGKYALKFTQTFLREFEAQTEKEIDSLGEHKDIIPKIAGEALGVERLSACAGIAIIKPHFPFSVAYELSADLMASAKEVKKKLQHPQKNTPFPCSALDFHILYDSSGIDLKLIRQKLQRDNGQTRLYGRPLIVTPQNWLAGATPEVVKWAIWHYWEDFEMRVHALNKTDELEKKRLLSNSQMHDIRSGLFLGKSGADARLKLIWERYKSVGLCNLVVNQQEPVVNQQEPSLFWEEEAESGKQIYVTGFLDAMDAADFFQGEAWQN